VQPARRRDHERDRPEMPRVAEHTGDVAAVLDRLEPVGEGARRRSGSV
jgi:hypothetical protein